MKNICRLSFPVAFSRVHLSLFPTYKFSIMKSILACLVAIFSLSLPSVVSAHGYVAWGLFNNVNVSGWNPNVDPYLSPTPQRIFRPIPGNGPVTDFSLIDVQCNGYAGGSPPFVTSPAPISQSIPAGSKVSLEWTQWPDSHLGVCRLTHNTLPTSSLPS